MKTSTKNGRRPQQKMKKMEDDIKKNKNGRRPQKKQKPTTQTFKALLGKV